MNIIDIKIDELNPYENNPRKNDEAVKYVAESIRQFGFKVPIVVDGDNTIIAGHTRFKAAKMLNLEDVPCIVADDLTPEQIKAFRLADNKVSEKAEWDFDLLEDELADILDINMEDLGFDFFEKDTKVVDDNYDKPAPKNPRSKLGDVFQLGRHHLMCGDSTDSGDVDTLMNGLQADMLLTDPPYNVDYEGSAGKIENDNMDDSAFREFLTRAFFNAKSHMKPGGAFHVWHADSEGYNFRGALQDAGLKIRQCLIWVKNSLVLGRQDFQWKHEPCLYGENPLDFPLFEECNDDECQPCLYGWKDGRHYWFKNRKQTTVLYFDKPQKSAEHPTMKPVPLFDYEMKCNTKPGQIVLDLFGGSGTAIIAAEQNERTAYVMEFDPKYVDVIIDRWETFTGERAVKLNAGEFDSSVRENEGRTEEDC